MREGAQDYFVKGPFWGDGLARAIRDAIERRRTEEAMRRSEDRFRSSIESAAGWLRSAYARRATRQGEIADFSVDYINASGSLPSAHAGPVTFSLHAGRFVSRLPHASACSRNSSASRNGGSSVQPRRRVLLCQESANDLKTPSYDFRAAKTERRDRVELE